MNAVMTEAPVVTNRCKIDEVFAGPFIELIGLAPRNPVVRGLILAQTGKMPEPERTTFEQIKDWVETTCDKKVRPANQTNGTRTPSRDGIVIKVEFSETEYGRANYSVPRSGSDEFALDADELLEMVQAAVDSAEDLDEVIEKIAGLIDEDAWNRCDPNLEDYGDYDYDQHESDDSGNSEIEFSRDQIRDRLLAFLRERHPNLLEELA
jgi:hypothetical protein